MATRTAQVVIQVDDKSLIELNQEIKILENSVKNLKVGTQEWVAQNEKLGVLKSRFKEAGDAAKILQGQVAKVAGGDQLKAVSKLGTGMVGAFTAANGALGLLTGNKAFDAMTAQATTLMSIMGGLNQISELFSKTTLTSLKSVGAGFKTMMISAQTASAGVKAALISTGIGALIVLVGLLIANWEKLKNIFNKSTKEAQKLVDVTKQQAALTSEEVKTQKLLIEGQYDFNKAQSDTYNTAAKIYEINKLTLKDLDAQIVAQEAVVAQLEKQLQNADTLFGIGEKKKRLDIQNKLDLAKADLAGIEAQKKVTESKTAQSEIDLAIVEATQKNNDEIDKLNNKLIKLGSELYSNQKIYETQNRILEEQIRIAEIEIGLSGGSNKKAIEKYRTLKSQLEANKEIQRQAKLQLDLDLKSLQIESNRNVLLDDAALKINILNDEVRKISIEYERATRWIEQDIRLLDLIKQGYEDGAKVYENIVNFDVKRNKILKERTEKLFPSELSITKEIAASIENYVKSYTGWWQRLYDAQGVSKEFDQLNIVVKDTIKELNNIVSIINNINDETAQVRENLLKQAGISKEYEKFSIINRRIIDDAVKEYTIRKAILLTEKLSTQQEITSLEAREKKVSELQANYTETRKQLLEQNELNEQIRSTLLDQYDVQLKISNDEKKSEVDRGTAKEKAYDLAKQISDIQNNIASTNNNILSTQQSINDLSDDQEISINKINDDKAKTVQIDQEILNNENEITYALEDQLRLSKRLQNFTEKYNQEIEASTKAIITSMELVAVGFDNAAKRAQDRIDKLSAEYDLMNQKEADRQDRLLKYEEELKDAGGTRYDELLRLIDQEKKAKNSAYIDEKKQKNELAKLEHQRLVAEHQAAQWRKAQAIIDAVVQGALAVIKSLPNVFLSLAVGIASAAQVAIISAQKIPDVPPLVQYKKGGFTGEGDEEEVAGIAHKNEYIVPSKVVKTQSAQHHIAALEEMRTRGYQGDGNEDEVAGVVHKKEYIIPAKVVKTQSAQHHIAALEEMRTRGYQGGGFVQPVNGTSSTSVFDYEKLAQTLVEAIKEMPNPQVGLVNISNGLKQVELTKSQAGISR